MLIFLPHLFGKGYNLMNKMGYPGEVPLGKGEGIVEPLATHLRPNKLKRGVCYSEQENESFSTHPKSPHLDKSRSKHGESSSSTLVCILKEKDIIDQRTTNTKSMNLSFPDLHLVEEPFTNAINNEYDDDSTKWEFE